MPSTAKFNAPSGAVADVYIIDSGTHVDNFPAKLLLQPEIEGFDNLNSVPIWCFLVRSPTTGEKVLFDLGMPGDIDSFTPAARAVWEYPGLKVNTESHVAEILSKNGIPPAEIKAVVWSHQHPDHIGDIRTFPPSTDLVVGPGFQKAYRPFYPTNPESNLHESYFTDRRLEEISFAAEDPKTLSIGPFRAHDYFGDGSFYLLDAPGHDHGHVAGLARTTADTFILMGGDLCHHGGELRPSPFLPLPPQHRLSSHFVPPRGISPCPGAGRSFFQALNRARGRKIDEPFFDPVVCVDREETFKTLQKAQVADADENVLFVFAHDHTVGKGEMGLDLFPKAANGWKEKGWKAKIMWDFLGDLAGAAASQAAGEGKGGRGRGSKRLSK